MEKQWIVKEQGNTEEIMHLADALNIGLPVAGLLVQRGIKTAQEAHAFFKPELSQLHDPFLMKDMDLAVSRLMEAVSNKEKVLVYGDYDVDGTSAVSMMYTFLKSRIEQVGYYIPDRHSEGYGISNKAIDYAAENGYTLIIALDCGIKANDKISYASTKNIDFIICDHHLPAEEIPGAYAVLDPKQPDCLYPYKELSGCGVGFKLLQAFTIKNNLPLQELYSFLDLVAISIASDIVPITGENRILAFHGLRLINTNPRTGIRAIMRVAGVEGYTLSVNDLVFKIGPRINAAGRIETGTKAVDLLVASDQKEADIIAGNINAFNIQRKDLDVSITAEALAMIDNNPQLKSRKSTVLYNPKWHEGVIGIVASRLIESYYRPTVIFTDSKGLLKGSARSVHGFDLYQAVEGCADLLEGFGGHMFAAGLSLKPENFEKFSARFEEVVSASIRPDQLVPRVDVDAKLRLSDISMNLAEHIHLFQPFGPGNMMPLFMTGNLSDNNSSKKVGKSFEHLKFEAVEAGDSYTCIPSIAFQMGHFQEAMHKRGRFDACYYLDINEFNGRKSLQLRIKDLKIQ